MLMLGCMNSDRCSNQMDMVSHSQPRSTHSIGTNNTSVLSSVFSSNCISAAKTMAAWLDILENFQTRQMSRTPAPFAHLPQCFLTFKEAEGSASLAYEELETMRKYHTKSTE